MPTLFKTLESITISEEDTHLTTAAELGERRIIEIILQRLRKMPHMPIPFGDDVSAIDTGNRKLAVLKTDMLVGKTDMPPKMTPWHAARKAAVMNISDLAAKGVKTTALLAAVGIPRDTKLRDIEEIADGLDAGAREYDAYVLGGDTNEAADLVISCVACGIGIKNRLMLRTGAKPGDIAAVTGYFGKTSAGLKILLEGLSAPPKIEKPLVDSVLMPHARLNEGLALAESGAVTSSIDSSDGLAWSLHEVSKASKVGFIIDKLPIAKQAQEFAKLQGLNPSELALYGGEEYELVVTVKPKLWKKATEKTHLIRIGRVTEEKKLIFKAEGKEFAIEAQGWEHFKTSLPKS